MKFQTRQIIIVYLLILFLSFFIGPYLGLVNHEMQYNITCDDGRNEIFYNDTLTVCGKENPLRIIEIDNYLNYEINKEIQWLEELNEK